MVADTITLLILLVEYKLQQLSIPAFERILTFLNRKGLLSSGEPYDCQLGIINDWIKLSHGYAACDTV